MDAAMSANSVQDAHDALLAIQPSGATHVCPLCQSGAGTAEKEEVAQVAAADGADERQYSATEHLALLNDAVARETASLTSSKETLETTVETLESEKAALASEKTELQNQVDVLEVAKTAAETARDEAVAKHETYVQELNELAALETRKTERAEKVREAAGLSDEVIAERIERWAGLTEEAFESLVADLTEASKAKKPKADDAEDEADNGADEDKEKAAARETAAFSRGTQIKTPTGTTFRGLMAATGRVPSQQ